MPVQTHFDFRHPTRIVHGPGSIACLADCFSPADKVLIVSDQVLGEIGTVEAVTAALGNIPHAVYLKDGSSEPTQESVEDGAQAYRQERCTAIIGLGGGSPMDVAKMIGVLASNDWPHHPVSGQRQSRNRPALSRLRPHDLRHCQRSHALRRAGQSRQRQQRPSH